MTKDTRIEELHSETLRLLLELAHRERDIAIARAKLAESENRRLRTQLRAIRQNLCNWIDRKPTHIN